VIMSSFTLIVGDDALAILESPSSLSASGNDASSI
jgi:hypothetical protein